MLPLCGCPIWLLPLLWLQLLPQCAGGPTGTCVSAGIDLGTSSLRTAVFDVSTKTMVTVTQNAAVAWRSHESIVTGDAAFELCRNLSWPCVMGAKRFIGLDQRSELNKRNNAHMLTGFRSHTQRSYAIGGGSSTTNLFLLRSGTVNHHKSAAEVVASLLLQGRLFAEEVSGSPVDRAVISVPQASNSSHRDAYNESATIAGFSTSELSYNTVNAFAAYRYYCLSPPEALTGRLRGSQVPELKNVVFFQLGASAFDVSVVSVSRSTGQVAVVKSDGVAHMGGEDFNFRVLKHLMAEFPDASIWTNKNAVDESMFAIEKMKIELSSSRSAVWLGPVADGAQYKYELTRETFEKINMDLFETSIAMMGAVVERAGLQAGQIDEVFILGGSTRIPAIPRLVEEYFRKASAEFRTALYHERNWEHSPCYAASGLSLEQMPAAGAALLAWERGQYSGPSCSSPHGAAAADTGTGTGAAPEARLFPAVSEHAFGVNLIGGVAKVMIPKGAMLPAKEFYGFALYDSSQPGIKIDAYMLGASLNTRMHGIQIGTVEMTVNPRGRISNPVMSPSYFAGMKNKVYVPNVHVFFEMTDNSAIRVTINYTVNNMSASSLFPIPNATSLSTTNMFRKEDLSSAQKNMRLNSIKRDLLKKSQVANRIQDVPGSDLHRFSGVGAMNGKPQSLVASAFAPKQASFLSLQGLRGHSEKDSILSSPQNKLSSDNEGLWGHFKLRESALSVPNYTSFHGSRQKLRGGYQRHETDQEQLLRNGTFRSKQMLRGIYQQGEVDNADVPPLSQTPMRGRKRLRGFNQESSDLSRPIKKKLRNQLAT